MKFREHRGSLADAMLTEVTLPDRAALLEHCRKIIPDALLADTINDSDMTVSKYGRDERIGWDTHIVSIAGYGVVGFTDGPVEEPQG